MPALALRIANSEMFGFVTFFIATQSWVLLAEAGIGPIATRLAASLDITEGSDAHYPSAALVFLRKKVQLLGVIATCGLALALTGAHLFYEVAANEGAYLNYLLVVLCGAIRLTTLYEKSVFIGLKKYVLVNSVQTILLVVRHALALALLWYTQSVMWFMVPQALFLGIESFLLTRLVRSEVAYATSMPVSASEAGLKRLREEDSAIWRNSAITTALWIANSQIDKLLLSLRLELSEFGLFFLVTSAASVLSLISRPVSIVSLPAFVKSYRDGGQGRLAEDYMRSVRLMVLLITPITSMLFSYSSPILQILLDGEQTGLLVSAFRFVLLGNMLMILSSLIYLTQIASQTTNLHLKMNLVYSAVSLPVMILAVFVFGYFGAAITWFTLNSFVVVGYAPIALARLDKSVISKFGLEIAKAGFVIIVNHIAADYLLGIGGGDGTIETLVPSLFVCLIFALALILTLDVLRYGSELLREYLPKEAQVKLS